MLLNSVVLDSRAAEMLVNAPETTDWIRFSTADGHLYHSYFRFSGMVSAKRYAAVVLLLVIGVLCMQAPGAVTDLQTTYDATPVDPAADATAIAAGDSDVADLDEWAASMSSEAASVVHHTAANGSYNGSVPSEFHSQLDDYENTTIAVYDGQYYRMNATTAEQTTEARLALASIPPTEATTTVATPYTDTDTDSVVRRAIEQGNVTTDTFAVQTGLISRNGNYYLVTPRNEGAVVGKLFAMIGGFLLNPIGNAYSVAGIGLIVALRRRYSARPLDERSALAVVGGTIAVLWLWTTLSGSGTVGVRYTVFPLMGAVAALGLLAGLYLRWRSWHRLGVLTVGTIAVGIGAVVGVLGVFGLLLGPLALFIGWLGSLPLVGYGYVFTAREESGSEPSR